MKKQLLLMLFFIGCSQTNNYAVKTNEFVDHSNFGNKCVVCHESTRPNNHSIENCINCHSVPKSKDMMKFKWEHKYKGVNVTTCINCHESKRPSNDKRYFPVPYVHGLGKDCIRCHYAKGTVVYPQALDPKATGTFVARDKSKLEIVSTWKSPYPKGMNFMNLTVKDGENVWGKCVECHPTYHRR